MTRHSPLITLWVALICCSVSEGYRSPPAAPNSRTLQNEIQLAPPQLAPVPSPSTPPFYPHMPDCELRTLSMLGWQQAFNASGYSITAELPANCSSDTWQSLNCLSFMTKLTLTGSLPDLPDSWAVNGSFPALQAMNFSTSSLAGSLPSSWANPTAFPRLSLLNFSSTQLSGTLPTSWGQAGVFAALTELHLAQVNITGRIVQCHRQKCSSCVFACNMFPQVLCQIHRLHSPCHNTTHIYTTVCICICIYIYICLYCI